MATTKAAHKRLGTQRVRRLLAIELEDEAQVGSAANGSLAGDIIRVWIDVPSTRRALIEVRRGERSVARRSLAISGFPADVAARVVAIATSEMVRVQARVQRRPAVNDDQARRAAEAARRATFAVESTLSAVILPASSPAWTLGSELSLAHQIGITSQALYGRWQLGDGDDGHLRWLEIGVAAGVRLPLAPLWRVRLAAKAGGVSLALPQAAGAEARNDWTVHAGGQLGVEAELAPHTWLGLSVEPGALLRTVGAYDAAGRLTEVGGFALGLGLGLVAEP